MDATHSLNTQEEFMEHFVRIQSRLYGYIATLLPQRDDADEIFQQTSLLLWKKREQYDPKRNFLSWAYGIAHNEIRNFLRTRRQGVYLSETLLEKLAELRHATAERIDAQLQNLVICLEKLTAEQAPF